MCCDHPMRGNTKCKLEKGHIGPHTSVAFYCDSCGNRRRGHPHVTDEDALTHCFFCCMETRRSRFENRDRSARRCGNINTGGQH